MQRGSSGLLPQPGGFAGFVFLVVPVDLDARYQTVLVKCPNGPGDDVQLDPAGRPSGGDELSAQDRPACDDNGLKCFEHLLLKRIWLHPTSQALGTPVRRLIPWRNEHDVAMDQRESTVEVLAATANGFQPATCGLHVLLLRHRPCSIPRRGRPGRFQNLNARPQYHLPRAKPPKAISPISTMISPNMRLQNSATTIPMMTRMPPREIPPMPPPRRSGVAILASVRRGCGDSIRLPRWGRVAVRGAILKDRRPARHTTRSGGFPCLFPQPGGFEGFTFVVELAYTHDHAVPDREQLIVGRADL